MKLVPVLHLTAKSQVEKRQIRQRNLSSFPPSRNCAFLAKCMFVCSVMASMENIG